MKAFTRRVLMGYLTVFAAFGITRVTFAQGTRTLRIVEYNIDADTTFTVPMCGLVAPFTGTGGTFTTSCSGNATNGGVLEGIGEEIINGDPAQPIDILALNETTSNTTTVQPIVNALNAFYLYYTNQPAGYAMSTYQATESGGSPSSGNGPNALVYNTNTLQLLASVPVDPSGGTGNLGATSGEYREVMRYEFAPTGVTAGTNNEFYIYVSHYKASSGSGNDKARLGEAGIVRSNVYFNLPANARVLYMGDFNVDDNSGEAGYQTLCSNSVPGFANTPQGQAVDPLNILWGPYTSASGSINWSTSTTSTQILFMLSEKATARDYRDDFQVMTSNVYYDVAGGLQYVPSSYHVFGNNGSFTYGASVNSSGNTALKDLDPALTNRTGLTAAVLLEDLTGASDHLPTVADYTIPVGSSALTFTTSQVNETCNGQSIGSITVTASGGSGSGYTYSDNDGSSFQSSNLFSGLAAGSYTVVVKDGSGNSTTGQVVTITEPTAVTFSTSHANETCNGQSSGSSTVTASGGSGSGYTYSDNNGSSFQSVNLFSGLSAGSYTIVVKDSNGCSSSGQVVTITQPSAVTFSTSHANETCNGQSIGSITVAASGGSGSGYTHSDNNGSSFQSSNLFSGLAAGSYTVVVKDGNGCSSTGQVVTIAQPSAVTFTTSQANEICNGQSIGSITVAASGGSGSGYTYSDNNGLSFQSSNLFSGLSAGSYTVVVKDSVGCASTGQVVTITQPAALSCSVSPSIVTNCVGNSQTFTANVGGGTPAYTYSWSGPNSFSAISSSIAIDSLQPSNAGTYSVTVTDANGCQSSCTATLVVNPAPATPTAANNGPILEGTTLNLTASTVDGTTYSWTGPNGFTSTGQNPSISNAPAAASGTYVVTVTDSNGCTAVGSTAAVVTALRITSITAQGNDIYLTWLTIGGTTNIVQVAPGNPGYNTNFTDIGSSLTIVGGSGVTNANYEDVGGATNSPNQFYRVHLVP